MKRTHLFILCLALAAFLPVSAQAQAVLGTIQGTISDDSGAAIPGASVTIDNNETGASRTVFSGDTGLFVAKALRSGNYNVTASLEGMQTIRRESVQLQVGQTVDVNFTLGVSTVAEAITVTGESQAIELSRSSAATYVSELEVQSLPTSGRDFTDFALLTPTVQTDTVRGFITIAGQRGMYSGLNIDGTDGKSAFFGYGRGGEATENSGLVIAQDSVKEFQIVTSAFSPEYGADGGGYVNVITKSGSNDLKGTAFFLFQDEGMASDLDRSPLDQFDGRTDPIVPSEFDRENIGVSIGGPLKKDKTHFFFSFDDSNRESPITRTIRTPGIYDAVLEVDGTYLPGAAALVEGYTRAADGTAEGQFLRDVSNTILFAKIDHQFTDSTSFTLRTNLTEYERLSSFKDEESQKTEDTTSWVGALVNVIGSDKVNEARFQMADDQLDRLSQRVGEPVEAEIEFRFGSRDQVGKLDFLPILVEEDKLQFQDNFSYLFGNHDLKFGVNYQQDDLAQVFKGSADGRYRFSSIEQFLANEPSELRVYFGDVTFPNYDEQQSLLGIYAQDTIKPNANLTVNYGIRYGATYNPGNLEHRDAIARDIPDDTDNIEPRVGFTYSPGGTGSHVIRGGFGIFHGRTPSLLFASQVQENGIFPNYGRITVRPGQVGFVPLGTDIDNENPPVETIPSVGFVDPSFEDAEIMRVNFGYERDLGNNWTGGVDLVYAEGSELQTNIDLNRTYTIDEFGRPFASSTRPDPTTNISLTRQSIGESEYQALTFKVNRRFTGKYQMQAHYTLADDKDTDSNERSATGSTASFGGADRSLWNPRYDYGPSENDVENRLVVSGVYLLPWDFKVSGIFENRSGVPYNPTDTGFDFASCGFFTLGFDCVDARPVDSSGNVLGRNSFRNESVTRLDLRLSKFFEFGNDKSIDVFFEVFNLFDEQVFRVCNGFSCDDQRDPTEDEFGLASSRVTQPQIYQLGGRFSW